MGRVEALWDLTGRLAANYYPVRSGKLKKLLARLI
jgi:hypothetical protein